MRRACARVARLGLLAGLAVAVASCGQPNDRIPETGATLEGTVKYGSEDVQFALVVAVAGDASATGKIDEEGRYKIENCPLGEVKVAVNTDAGRGDYMSASMSKTYQGPTAKGAARKSGIKFIDVPKKYHEPTTTPLKTTVNKGPNTYDIVIPK